MTELILTLRQPAQLGDRARKDFVLGTTEHIPGSVVRGAFAAAWLARNGVSRKGTSQRGEFLALFEGGVRFGPLLPDGTEVASLAVVGHKYAPLESCATAEFDRAETDEDPPLHCPNPDCGSPLEQLRGLRGERPAPGRRTSVAISAAGIARPGQLFTRESLRVGQSFRGTIAAGDSQLLKILDELGPVRVGGRRTTHGLADVMVRDGREPPTAQRRDDGMLILRLRSPAIFTDDLGRPSRDPNPHELEEVLGTPVSVVRRWTRWEQTGGWHVASGLPKPQELTVCAGSAYLFQPERAVGDSVLARLALRGVGLRRQEGFGDLAPPPALTPGKAARDAEEDRLVQLTNDVRPLLRVLMRPRSGDVVRAQLNAHAVGDPQAGDWIRQKLGSHPERDVRAAAAAFAELTPRDAARVMERLEQ